MVSISTWLTVLAALLVVITGPFLLILMLPWRLTARCEGAYFEGEDAPDPEFTARFNLSWWLLSVSAVRSGLWGPTRLDGTFAGIPFRMRVGGDRKAERSTTMRQAQGSDKREQRESTGTKEQMGSPRRQRFRKRSANIAPSEVMTLMGAGIRLIGRARRGMKLKVRGDITFGFEDPAATAWTAALAAAAGRPRGLALRTDYQRVGAAGWLALEAHVKLYKFVGALLWTAWTPEVRRIWLRRLKAVLRSASLRRRAVTEGA